MIHSNVLLNVLVIIAFLVHFQNDNAYRIYNAMHDTIETKYV